jgi:hypothetical protein
MGFSTIFGSLARESICRRLPGEILWSIAFRFQVAEGIAGIAQHLILDLRNHTPMASHTLFNSSSWASPSVAFRVSPSLQRPQSGVAGGIPHCRRTIPYLSPLGWEYGFPQLAPDTMAYGR